MKALFPRVPEIDRTCPPVLEAVSDEGSANALLRFIKRVTWSAPISVRVSTCLVAAAILPSLLAGADLSSYRGFQLGMSLSSAVKHSGMDISEVTVRQQRPARIEELAWNPQRFSRELAENDPVQKVTFSFYNGQLSRIAIDYDTQKTEGMTAQDLTDATSAHYGPPNPAHAGTSLPSNSYSEGVTVMAHWDDADTSISLVQSPYGGRFGLIAVSKELDALMQEAIAGGKRLDTEEEPGRLKKQNQTSREKLDRTATVNKLHFRP